MSIAKQLHELVWGPWLLILFLGSGLFYTIKLKGFQILRLPDWWRLTIGTLKGGTDNHFATSCTALAATVGTGNIAGVATAIASGGPGAVFWMWVSAFLGMATAYAETFLGIQYRYEGENGQFICGPFVYLEKGLGCKSAAVLYAFFCVAASLGMGSMVQANSISESFSYVFHYPVVFTGLIVTFLAMAVVLGGINRISKAAERLVPFSAGLYLILCGIVIFAFYDRIPDALFSIVSDAFSAKSMAGGAAGYGISKALQYGIARGVFSNEAGLGSLAVLHGEARNTTPEEQGMWAVFEVFFDTIISCTLTALVILCVVGAGKDGNGTDLISAGVTGSSMLAYCFSKCFDQAGAYLIAAAMSLFAFATIIAWFYLGRQAAVYITYGSKRQELLLALYAFFYLNAVFFGCIAKIEFVWQISDVFNGLMAVPNLIGLLLLSKKVKSPF